MRLYANRDYSRNQTRSSRRPDNDLSRLCAILQRYRGAILNGNRKGLRAMGEELRPLGHDAMLIGLFTAPMNPASFPGARITRPGRYTQTKTEKIIWEEWSWPRKS
jgi:hypothetical protein